MSTISNERFLLAMVETMDGKASLLDSPAPCSANKRQINFKEVAEKLGMKEGTAYVIFPSIVNWSIS